MLAVPLRKGGISSEEPGGCCGTVGDGGVLIVGPGCLCASACEAAGSCCCATAASKCSAVYIGLLLQCRSAGFFCRIFCGRADGPGVTTSNGNLQVPVRENKTTFFWYSIQHHFRPVWVFFCFAPDIRAYISIRRDKRQEIFHFQHANIISSYSYLLPQATAEDDLYFGPATPLCHAMHSGLSV